MRVVIDTNVFISAVLFKGEASRLVNLWQSNKFTFLISGEILKEYIRVLSYPKFQLQEVDIKSILEEQLLPFIETVKVKDKYLGILKDKDDEKFLNCAYDGNADCIISGDSHLLEIGSYKGIPIITVKKFFRYMKENNI